MRGASIRELVISAVQEAIKLPSRLPKFSSWRAGGESALSNPFGQFQALALYPFALFSNGALYLDQYTHVFRFQSALPNSKYEYSQRHPIDLRST